MAQIKKKLILKRETLRDLSESDLRNVVGAAGNAGHGMDKQMAPPAHPPTHFWFTQ
jgi:hypothetical protein